MKRAWLIDFDGTVVDSMPLLYRMYHSFLQLHGVEGTPEEFDELNGTSIGDAVALLGQRHKLKLGLGELVKEYGEKLIHAYSERVSIMPGVERFLQRAAELGNTIAMVTSASRRLVERCLEAKGLRGYFVSIFTAAGLKMGKPHPEIYQRALARLGLRKSDAIAIEDSTNGVAAARGAGLDTLLYAPDGATASDGVQVIRSWSEAEQLLC